MVVGIVQKLCSINFCRLTTHSTLVVQTLCFFYTLPPRTVRSDLLHFLVQRKEKITNGKKAVYRK